MIEHNVDLGGRVTMATPAKAAAFARVTNVEQLRDALTWARTQRLPWMLLAGGSNLIFADDFPGLVIHPALQTLTVSPLPGDRVRYTGGAGVPWQQLVDDSITRGFWGLENLTRIPGTLGAAPIQNIGAYGVELEQLFEQLIALDTETGELVTFNHADCEFSYRQSIFKREARDRYIIVEVSLMLQRAPNPVLGYQGLQQLADTPDLQPAQVAERVAALRAEKLPDPGALPNSGSFFHNPVVAAGHLQTLLARYPGLVHYPLPSGRAKLAAGWLIEHAGFKGRINDGVGVHDRQALVLVNPGRRPGQQVLALAQAIQARVQELFDVELVVEPRVYP